MKAITCDVILEGCSTRADGSLSVRFSTPELAPEEKTVFFELQKRELKMLLQPKSEAPSELKDVRGEFDRKTPSMRLRAVLFVAWKQQGEPGEFDDWYRKKMETYINDVKENLKPI
jgi:hypothetical protein